MDNFVCLTICIVHAQAFLRCFDWRDLLKCSRLFSRKPSFPQTAKNTARACPNRDLLRTFGVPVAFVSCERVNNDACVHWHGRSRCVCVCVCVCGGGGGVSMNAQRPNIII